jgi:VanZ like family
MPIFSGSNMTLRLKSALPLMLQGIFVFGLVLTTVLLLIPSYKIPKAFDFYDKVLVFVTLTISGLLAFSKHRKIIVLGLFFYGGLMEVLQSALTTTRHGEWLDWLTDGVGVALGCGIYRLFNQFLRKFYYKYNSNISI